MVPNRDFVLGDKSMFTSEEAFELQEVGSDLGVRLPRAHEWRGIGYWITHEGEYVKKFDLTHAGHYWQGTEIPQRQDGGAYYWTGSSSKDREHVRAVRVLPDGTFDITFRPYNESMCIRPVIDPQILKNRK